MDILENIFEKIQNYNLKKETEQRILDKLDIIKSHILDVITYSKSYEEIKETVEFPVLIDKDNGILFVYQTKYNGMNVYFLLVWKNGILDTQIMNIDISSKIVGTQMNNNIPEEKEEVSSEEPMESIPEEKEEVSSEEPMESIPEEKEEVSSEESIEGIPEEKEEVSSEEPMESIHESIEGIPEEKEEFS